MKYDHLLVRYGELTLKGSNRKKFVNQLRNNVNKSLKGLDGLSLKANEIVCILNLKTMQI